MPEMIAPWTAPFLSGNQRLPVMNGVCLFYWIWMSWFANDLKSAAQHLPIQQMLDQRVAKVSQILMKPGGPMAYADAVALFERYKQEIGGDPEKFADYARAHSEDEASAAKGGDLGYVTRANQLPPQLDEVVFVKEPQPGVYGPIGSKRGLHLIYLESCGQPMGSTEALFSPPGKTLDFFKRK